MLDTLKYTVYNDSSQRSNLRIYSWFWNGQTKLTSLQKEFFFLRKLHRSKFWEKSCHTLDTLECTVHENLSLEAIWEDAVNLGVFKNILILCRKNSFPSGNCTAQSSFYVVNLQRGCKEAILINQLKIKSWKKKPKVISCKEMRAIKTSEKVLRTNYLISYIPQWHSKIKLPCHNCCY